MKVCKIVLCLMLLVGSTILPSKAESSYSTTITTATVEISNGTSKYEIPATVSTEIVNTNGEETLCSTTTTVKICFDEEGNIITNKAKVSGYDGSYSVLATLTTNYVSYSDVYKCIKITNVTGGYTIVDSTVTVYSQSVVVGHSSPNGQQNITYTPTSSSFNFSTGFSKDTSLLAVYGSHYYLTIGRSDSTRTWSFELTDVVNNAS